MRNLLIGYTNAKKICNKLIVGVTVDDLVPYKYKKVMNLFKDQIEMIRSCKYVDAVVSQYDMDKLKFYKKLDATMLLVDDNWYETVKWKKYEELLGKEGIKIVYFSYLKGIFFNRIINAFEVILKSFSAVCIKGMAA